jgi:hypothetical protein
LPEEKKVMDKKLPLIPVVIYGADTVGKILLKKTKGVGIPVVGFADYNPNLTNKLICGVKVYYAPEITKHFKNVVYIISVLTIRGVVESLRKQGMPPMIPGGVLLDDYNTTQISPSYQIDFEKYQVEACKIAHNAFLKKNHVFLRSIDIMITERCSLKCAGCSNLMQYYEKPKDYNTNSILASIDQLLQHVDEILEARVIGGDAFMNPEWPRIVSRLESSDKVRRVMVYTNGVVIPKYFSALTYKKVVVVMTNYGKLSRNLAKISELFRKNGVWHIINDIKEWLDCSSIQKHNRTPKENDKLFENCIATSLTTMVDGRIFRCPFAANAFQLGAVEKDFTDYVDVFTLRNKKELSNYILSNKAMSICDYCTSRLLKNKITPAVQIKKPLKYERA